MSDRLRLRIPGTENALNEFLDAVQLPFIEAVKREALSDDEAANLLDRIGDAVISAFMVIERTRA